MKSAIAVWCLALLALLALLAWLVPPQTPIADAKGKAPPADRGHLVYGKGESLWRVPVNAKGVNGKPVEVAALGFKAAVIERLNANATGDAFLVSTADNNHFWVATTANQSAVPVVRHVCAGRATLSGDGRCVLCQADDGSITIERLLPSPMKATLAVEGQMASLAGGRTDRIVVVTERGLEGVSVADASKRAILAAVKPGSHLLVAPDGLRAAAVFSDGKGEALYGFVFDGKGVQRKLVIEAMPVAWSRDSQWLLVTKQARACVVRAVGGQYRCFNGFRGLGLAPDQKDVLLAKGSRKSMGLYRADLGGARSAVPSLFLRGAQGAALWLP